MKVRLAVVGDEAPGRVFEFATHDTFLFGRHFRAHCRIAGDVAVSRHHFILEAIPPRARLRDLGSKNGIRVNGVLYGGRSGKRNPDGSVPSVDLKPGDEIRVGQTTLRFEVEPDADNEETATAAAEPETRDPRRVDFSTLRPEPGPNRATPPGPDAEKGDADALVLEPLEPHEPLPKPPPRPAPAAPAAPPRPKPSGIGALLSEYAGAKPPPWPRIPGYTSRGTPATGNEFGWTYEATRDADGLPVAVKVLQTAADADPRGLVQFRREIAVNRSLRHENIVAFLDDGQLGGGLYLVVEHLGGDTVEARVAREGPPALAVAFPWMLQAAAGLGAAHALGLVHRDIKPANLHLAGSGAACAVKLADFGLAKILLAAGLSGFTATGAASQVPVSYMAPEQLADFKRATAMADVFSLAASYFYLLTGRPPYNFRDDRDPIATVLEFDVAPLLSVRPGLPPALAEVVGACLAEKPDQRPRDGGALHAELAALTR